MSIYEDCQNSREFWNIMKNRRVQELYPLTYNTYNSNIYTWIGYQAHQPSLVKNIIHDRPPQMRGGHILFFTKCPKIHGNIHQKWSKTLQYHANII